MNLRFIVHLLVRSNPSAQTLKFLQSCASCQVAHRLSVSKLPGRTIPHLWPPMTLRRCTGWTTSTAARTALPHIESQVMLCAQTCPNGAPFRQLYCAVAASVPGLHRIQQRCRIREAVQVFIPGLCGCAQGC